MISAQECSKNRSYNAFGKSLQNRSQKIYARFCSALLSVIVCYCTALKFHICYPGTSLKTNKSHINVSHDYMSVVWWHAAKGRQSSHISPCILDASIWITVAGNLLNSNQHQLQNVQIDKLIVPPLRCVVMCCVMNESNYLPIFFRVISLAWANHMNVPVAVRHPRRILVNEQYKITILYNQKAKTL